MGCVSLELRTKVRAEYLDLAEKSLAYPGIQSHETARGL